MLIDLYSLGFNIDVPNGGTPTWGTALGQGQGHKINIPDSKEFVTAMLYRAVCLTKDSYFYTPMGKGGKQTDTFDVLIVSLFDKVFVNGHKITGGKFLLTILKRIKGKNHVGRLELKYNPHTEFNDIKNEDCISLIEKQFGLSSKAAWFIDEINLRNQDELHFTAYFLDKHTSKSFSNTKERKKVLNSYRKQYDTSSYISTISKKNNDEFIQCIYFGTPGSGKSFKVKEVVGEIDVDGYNIDCPNVFRTTFHPDSDYSTFVGCYKPMMEEIDGEKEDLVYEFVPQAFTDAYIYAYEHEEESTYLVIEEINRGNCAQIFGDLFQLLDRNESGCSEYSIKADKDLRKYLEDKLGVGHEGIKDGKLSLPSNLNIVATMNTSDQSLFPMDSAFKRRWEWIYVPIEYKDEKVRSTSFEISVGNKKYSWIEFLKAVNTKIKEVTDSEDKQMGNFFIKDSIVKEKFVNKVMSYLWFEVCKENYGSADYFFHYIKDNADNQSESVDNEDSFTYNDLFSDKCEEILNGFMKYLNVQELDNSNMTSTEALEEE